MFHYLLVTIGFQHMLLSPVLIFLSSRLHNFTCLVRHSGNVKPWVVTSHNLHCIGNWSSLLSYMMPDQAKRSKTATLVACIVHKPLKPPWMVTEWTWKRSNDRACYRLVWSHCTLISYQFTCLPVQDKWNSNQSRHIFQSTCLWNNQNLYLQITYRN